MSKTGSAAKSRKKRTRPSDITEPKQSGDWAEWLSSLSPESRAVAEAELRRLRGLPVRPKAELDYTGDGLLIRAGEGQHKNAFSLALQGAAGSRSVDFVNRTTGTMAALLAGADGKVSAERYNTGLAIMAAVEPENELEALLAVQMIAANEGALKAMSGLRNSEMINQTQAFGNLANKFMRTFTAQMEQLRKMRSGGEQIVKHIHVHEGGQAVVAGRDINTVKGGGGSEDYAGQCHAAEAATGRAALPRTDPTGNGVPVTLHAERAMQDARRE